MAHFLYCDIEPTQCLGNDAPDATTWSKWQKSASFAACCCGVMLYVLGKKPQVGGVTVSNGPVRNGQPWPLAVLEKRERRRFTAEP
jgi:hypothetical protein